MSINNLPSNIQHIVQNGFLLRFFNDALAPQNVYRGEFEALQTPNRMGESFTFTKKGLLTPVRTPMTPVTNSDLTSGLTTERVGYEQYSVTMNQYGKPTDVNLISSEIAIEDMYRSAFEDLGQNAGRSLDQLARKTLFVAYNGGRTFATAASVTSTSLLVKNKNGFDYVMVNGVRQATSVSNPHPIKWSAALTAASVTAVAVGTENTAEETTTGTLTLAVAISAAQYDAVISDYAPFSIRPNGKTSAHTVTGSDILVFQNLVDATNRLRGMGVEPHKDGFYHAILDPVQVGQLFADASFNQVFRGLPDAAEIQRATIGIAGGVKIMTSNEAPNGANVGGVTVRRGIITGKGLGYEARSVSNGRWLESNNLSGNGHVMFSPEAHVSMILRLPLDVLQQVVTLSWSFIGDWVCATDSLTTFGGSSAYLKRAVVLETA